MLSNNQRKLINQLGKKKYRVENKLFIAEGKKIVNELVNSNLPFKTLFSTEENFHPKAELLKFEEMKKITQFKTPSNVLGIFRLPKTQKIIGENTTIAIDGINDPGNLGTIIRLCDWFGLSELICSKTTVDNYNPKVIQSSMGSIARVRCHYVENLKESLIALKKPIYGTSTVGNSIYKNKLIRKASYVFGNESHGISKSILEILDGELSIPKFKDGNNFPDSLNVASASAILLGELFRLN